jgi:integrase/recombinase XerD
MTLTLYRRHKRTCPNHPKSRRARHVKCTCVFWVDGVLGGREVRKSLRTRDSKKANQSLHEWESKEQVVERGAAASLDDAWTSMVADLEARKLSDQTIRKYKLLKRQMTEFGEQLGLKMLAQFDLDVLSKFRARWKDGPQTATKKLERLRAFFRFAHDRQWVESNPAVKMKLTKTAACPTMPLTPKQWLDLLTACDKFLTNAPVEGKMNALRLKSLLVLMRYSGMRVSDAVTLTADKLDGNRLFLYTQKTGIPVYTVLPDSVLRVLDATPRVRDTRYFWTGQGKRQTAIGDWQEKIKKVFDLAKISKGLGNAVSHRLRDTFAVELLQAGVPIERVSILLGHQSVRVTERHYNPWVRSRQEQLEADVASAWKLDPHLNDKNLGTKQVHFAKGRVN